MPGVVTDLFKDDTKIKQYVDILANRGIDWGLLGSGERNRLWERHILNSVAVAGLIPEGASVADVGSGAGLPGIPLAILRPDLQVTLIEPMLRRQRFLNLSIEELGLSGRVLTLQARAEDITTMFDVVTARAVAPLWRLLTWTAQMFMPAGNLLALKGDHANAELQEASGQSWPYRWTGEVLKVAAHSDCEPTHVVRIHAARFT